MLLAELVPLDVSDIVTLDVSVPLEVFVAVGVTDGLSEGVPV